MTEPMHTPQPHPSRHRRATRALAVLAALALLVLATAWGATAPAVASDGTDAPDETTTEGTETDYARMVLVLDSSGSMAEPAAGGTTSPPGSGDDDLVLPIALVTLLALGGGFAFLVLRARRAR